MLPKPKKSARWGTHLIGNAGCPIHSRLLRMSGLRHHRSVQGSQPGSNPDVYCDRVTKGLHRYYGTRNLHFITCSCYRRQPQLGTARRRDLFLKLSGRNPPQVPLRRAGICPHAGAFSSAHYGAGSG